MVNFDEVFGSTKNGATSSQAVRGIFKCYRGWGSFRKGNKNYSNVLLEQTAHYYLRRLPGSCARHRFYISAPRNKVDKNWFPRGQEILCKSKSFSPHSRFTTLSPHTLGIDRQLSVHIRQILFFFGFMRSYVIMREGFLEPGDGSDEGSRVGSRKY